VSIIAVGQSDDLLLLAYCTFRF